MSLLHTLLTAALLGLSTPSQASDCSSWHGVSVPLEGGEITTCTKKKVVIEHQEDARPIRWKYVEVFREAGWTRTSPEDAIPQVYKDQTTIKFLADGTAVRIVAHKQ